MVRAVLFDLGDTLFNLGTKDPRRDLEQGVRLAYGYLQGRGFPLPPQRKYLRKIIWRLKLAYKWSTYSLREIQLLDLIQRTHRKMGIVLDEASAEQYARHCDRAIHRALRPAPGAREALHRIQQAGYPLGLVCNTFMISKVLDERLEAEGFLGFFGVRVYSCDVGYLKPHPRIFQAALEGLGATAAESMFIGDTVEADIKGARALGLTTVLLVPDGRLPAGLCRPDHVIRRIGEVPRLLGIPGELRIKN